MHTRVAGRRELGLTRFARVVNADTVACTIVGVGLAGGIKFSVILAKLIIAWHASDEEGAGPNAEREEIERQLSEWPGFEDEVSIQKMVCHVNALDEEGDDQSEECEETEQQLAEMVQAVMDLDEGPPRGDTPVVPQNRGRATMRTIQWESEVVHASWGDRRHEGYSLKDSEQDKEAKEAKEGGRGFRKLGKPIAPPKLSITKLNPTLGQ